MKIVLIALLLVIAICCRKSSDEKNSMLVGIWEIRKSEGGIGGTINYPPGNQNIQHYDADDNFKWINDGLLVQFGKYSMAPTSLHGEWLLAFHSEVYGAVWSDTIILGRNQFVIKSSTTCCDMPSLTYVRIGE